MTMRVGPALLVLLAACAPTPAVRFHPSDRTFAPRPGPTPRAYTRSNIAELPDEPMHSVGVIEVTIIGGAMDRAIGEATRKGRELGCWIVVEHDAFVEHTRGVDVPIVLAHGGPPHASHVRVSSEVARFACVIRGAAPSRALARPDRMQLGA